MPSARDLYGSQWLAASDVPGGPVRCQITVVGTAVPGERQGDDREKIELELDQFRKPILVNTSNAERLIQAFGDDYELWCGKNVQISRHKVRFANRSVDGLLITPITKEESTHD